MDTKTIIVSVTSAKPNTALSLKALAQRFSARGHNPCAVVVDIDRTVAAAARFGKLHHGTLH
jgi:hypothetical protein